MTELLLLAEIFLFSTNFMTLTKCAAIYFPLSVREDQFGVCKSQWKENIAK